MIVIPTPLGALTTLTSLKIFNSKDVFYNNVGILPTVPINREDEILAKAVELAKANVALDKINSKPKTSFGYFISEKPFEKTPIGPFLFKKRLRQKN